ncbi:MAG TPA: hypothetical protein VEQ85_01540, partial [Lacipirellulaceae bacterium]|nr:hypothetical protein [Lacipirellulaceae bacterium]
MTTAEFIDALEQQRIVDADLARHLRGKVADDGARVGPDAILKFLVKTDVITQWKADELAALMLAPPPADDDEILDLAPLPEFDYRPSAGRAAAPIDASGPPPGPGVPGAERGPLFSSKAVTLDESSLESLAADQAGAAKRPGVYSLSKGGGKKKRSTKKRTASGKNQWDSPLLLLGGGALAILVVGGALLYYLLIRENASAVLNDANQLFAGGAYSQAIARYEEFVGKFSNHKDISQARVRLQMTRLWESVESMSDPAASLDVAQQVITAVE